MNHLLPQIKIMNQANITAPLYLILVIGFLLIATPTCLLSAPEQVQQLREFIIEETMLEQIDTLSPMARSVSSVYGDDLTLMEIPRSVTALTPEAMRQFGLEDLSDLEKVSAGTQRVNYFGIPGAPFLRGAKAGTFFNNMLRAYQRNEMPISFGSLDAMDIVRGPAPGHLTPTLVGGYVNFIPKSPYFDKFRGSLKVSIGRWEHYRAQVDLGGPTLILGKPAAYRLSFTGQFADAYWDRIGNDFVSLYGSTKIRLKKGLSVFTGAEYFKFKSNENAGWNRPTQQLVDRSRYVNGEPINITSPDWGDRANRDLASFPGAFFNGIADFNALVVPRRAIDDAVNGGLISNSARDALLDLQDQDDKARAYGQPLLSTGLVDPNYTASPNYAGTLAGLLGNSNVDGYRYTQEYFDLGGIVFTESIEGSQVLADAKDFADSRDFLFFFDFLNKSDPDRIIKNQFLLESLATEKLSSYGYAIETRQVVLSNRLAVTRRAPFYDTTLNYGASFRFTYAKMLQDFFAEPFSRRDITLADISPNTVVLTGPQRAPNGLNLWSPTRQGGANVRSQLYQFGFFATAHTKWNDRFSTFASLRGEFSRFHIGYPSEVELAGLQVRDAVIAGTGKKSYWMGALSPVLTIFPGLNLYAAVQSGVAIDPTQGGPIFGRANFTETELYEVGLKASLLDEKLYASLAAYYWDQARFNTREGISEPLRAEGVEFEAAWIPSEHFSINGAVTTQRIWRRTALGFSALPMDEIGWALNGGVLNTTFGRRPDANPDMVYPGAPEITAKLFAMLTLPNGIGFAGGPIYAAAYWHNFERTIQLPETLVWNVNLFYRAEKWEIFLAIENLTSEDVYIGAEPTFAANTLLTKAPPISWKLTCTYKF